MAALSKELKSAALGTDQFNNNLTCSDQPGTTVGWS